MRTAAATLVTVMVLSACAPDEDADGGATPRSEPQASTRTGEPRATASSSPSEHSGSASKSPTSSGPVRPRVTGAVATGLAVPWGIAFLPDGTALVSERDSAKILAVTPEGGVRTVGRLEEAHPQGEAGLLGLAVSPSYDEDSLVFAYVSTDADNRVVRMRYDGRRLGEPEAVLDGIPKGPSHDGGRLAFGADGHLYVSTGETGEEQLAQDRSSLAGKILRVTPEGDPAPGNPWKGSPVWTMGHRNVQGLAFDDEGRLWSSEFGSDTWDELNRIEKGRNYGWPLVEGRGDVKEYRNPSRQWRPENASPSGLAYAEEALWMASLRGQRLWRVPVRENGRVGKPKAFFVGKYGRLRTVVVAPDGSLWVATSNRDGRGEPSAKDDRILRVALD